MDYMLDKEIFNEKNKEFLQDYFYLFISRLTHSNLSLEEDLGISDSSSNAIRLNDSMKAFISLLERLKNSDKLSVDLINEVAVMVNNSSPYISNSYRKIGNFLMGTDISISKPCDIDSDMKKLVDDYNNLEMDPYDKEAWFHIGFIRIHPYEDGNGRTSRLIMNYNLLKEGMLPVIITNDLLSIYYEAIHENDVKKLGNIFRIQAFEEKKVINSLYTNYTDSLKVKK